MSKDSKGCVFFGKNGRVNITDNEIKIIPLIIADKTNKEIAIKLRISDRTVEDRLKRLREKLSCDSKTQLAVAFLRYQLYDLVAA